MSEQNIDTNQIVEVDPSQLHYMSRRPFAKAVGFSALAGYSFLAAGTVRQGLDYIYDLEAQIWPDQAASLTFLEDELPTARDDEVAIFLPGFGETDGPSEAEEWKAKGGLPADMPTCYLNYGNQELSIEVLGNLVRERINIDRIRQLTLFGNSMGGLYSVALATELQVPVRSMQLCSSPSSFENAYLSGISKWAAKLPASRSTATVIKFGGALYRQHQLHEDDDFKEIADAALKRTFTGMDPVALQSQLKLAYSIDIQEKVDKLGDVFVPGFSSVCYAGSQIPNSDRIVSVTTSGREYKQIFNDRLGVNFSLFGVDYLGHANVGATIAATREWTEATAGSEPETAKA